MRVDVGTFLLSLALFALALYCKKRWQKKPPALPVTTLAPFLKKGGFRVIFSRASGWFFLAAIFFLLVALSHPRMVREVGGESLVKSELPRSGIAIYFLLDESGSMVEKINTINARGMPIEVQKIALAKQAILSFIDGQKGLNLPGRRDDLVGLMAFARIPEVLCPLTLNRSEIADKLNGITPIQEDNRNGTAIGYAIFKAVNIIVATKHFAERQSDEHKSVYTIQNQAIIIVTDGLQSPHPDDKDNPFRFMPPDEAIRYASDNGVRVFYVGIDPILAKSEYADDITRMKKAMQASGGELFIVTGSLPIEDILAQIDTMEKSELPPEVVLSKRPVKEEPLVTFFVLLALVSLAAGTLLETTIGRSYP